MNRVIITTSWDDGHPLDLKLAEMGRRGREWVAKNRTYEILARQVEQRYLELVHKQI